MLLRAPLHMLLLFRVRIMQVMTANLGGMRKPPNLNVCGHPQVVLSFWLKARQLKFSSSLTSLLEQPTTSSTSTSNLTSHLDGSTSNLHLPSLRPRVSDKMSDEALAVVAFLALAFLSLWLCVILSNDDRTIQRITGGFSALFPSVQARFFLFLATFVLLGSAVGHPGLREAAGSLVPSWALEQVALRHLCQGLLGTTPGVQCESLSIGVSGILTIWELGPGAITLSALVVGGFRAIVAGLGE